MARKDSLNRFAILLLLVLAPFGALAAQVTETSVAFDSAGRVRTLTPALVQRFTLAAPVWPVSGDFLEARLYEVSTGGHVLAVERQDRRIERYPMTADNVAALRFAIDAAMTRSGQTVTEDRADEISQPARGAFVRNQMLLTWLVYGPSLAAMTNDAQAGTALYLLATGASYFVTTAISRKTVVTRAQNHLATDGALRGWGVGAGLSYVLGGDNLDGKTVAGIGLTGSLGGAILGFNRGKRLTDSEAQAATAVSTLAAATALGVSGSVGLIDDGSDNGRGVVAGIVAAGLVGYGVGPEYPRRAKYTVTKGDIQVTEVGATLGAALAIIPFVKDNFDTEPEPFFAVATAGLLAGTYIAERSWARKYDHSAWDAGQTKLGMAAGALMGTAVAVLTEPNAQATYTLVTAGGLFGALIGHNLAQPAKAGAMRTSRVGSRVTFDPTALGLAAAGVHGRHAVLSLSF